ncbi:hypothetical protein PAHAL_9G593700 [Panicum hallii]|uniref:Uncharacterized protein n=1 Tax=Panicum hallii TaxID=206008 RepID=A0A2T8I697_9POAL|nr:hypothetical protein PAHAL_9G593700 [Panicum hallii]
MEVLSHGNFVLWEWFVHQGPGMLDRRIIENLLNLSGADPEKWESTGTSLLGLGERDRYYKVGNARAAYMVYRFHNMDYWDQMCSRMRRALRKSRTPSFLHVGLISLSEHGMQR